MSYILDALKRAERERDFGRGAVPGLHTTTGADQGGEPSGNRGGWRATAPWAVAVFCLALGAVIAWWALGRTAPRDAVELAAPNLPLIPAPTPAPAPVVTPSATSSSASASASATPGAVTSAASAASITASASPPAEAAKDRATVAAPSAAASAAASAASRRAERAAAREALAARKAADANEARAKKEAAAAATAAAQPTATAAPTPTPAAAERLPALADLPAELRAQLPVLTFNGVTYSENPLYRMVIVNGQVVQEKGSPAPGVTLERIQPKGAVLSFKGTRYRVSF